MKDKLLVILGPTATGKSKLGITLAQKLRGEIISADAFLVYKGMDIGTAKPSKEELAQTKHHLIDILTPNETYSAAIFQKLAKQLIRDLNQANILPILVGGTGLYIQSLLEGYEFPPVREDAHLRGELAGFAEEFGNNALHARLRELSPDSAARIHPNNRRRVIRALEVSANMPGVSGRKQTEQIYDAKVFGLSMPRATLYERINQRVDTMFANGLIDEVKKLIAREATRQSIALRGIGYKEVIDCIDGKHTIETCKQLVARNTRRFAKRQFTWYNKMPYINWLSVENTVNRELLANNIYGELVEWRKLV